VPIAQQMTFFGSMDAFSILLVYFLSFFLSLFLSFLLFLSLSLPLSLSLSHSYFKFKAIKSIAKLIEVEFCAKKI